MRALLPQMPLEPEIALVARLGARGDDRHEQRALLDLPADLLVPRIAAAPLALVEPDLDAGPSQSITDSFRRLRVLRGVRKEDRFVCQIVHALFSGQVSCRPRR